MDGWVRDSSGVLRFVGGKFPEPAAHELGDHVCRCKECAPDMSWSARKARAR